MKASPSAHILEVQQLARLNNVVPENILEEMDEDLNSNNEAEEDCREEEKLCASINSPKIANKLNRKKFDFLYKRTCFRAVAEFFKQLFNSYVKKGTSSKRIGKHLGSHIYSFTSTVFANTLARVPN